MRITTRLLALLLLALPLPSLADAHEDALFRTSIQAREQAEAAEAALLAPGAYGQGVAALERARRDYQGGADDAAVASRLDLARQSLELAARTAGEARRTFAAPLAKRESARSAEACSLAGPAWVKAEMQLASAAQRLEKGDADGASKRAEDATQLYDAAELQAIKATLLTDARALVAGLEPAATEKFAPKTTAHAKALLGQAEAELDADRSRTDAARGLASAAVAESRHALALAAYLRAAREADATPEELVLAWESGLGRVAEAANSAADLSKGPVQATDGVVAAVAGQAADLGERNRQVAALEDEIRDLDSRLEGASSEARTLGERLQARERARQQFEQVEKAFPPDQAVVFRQGDDIIVRVQGLAFAPGSASLAAADPAMEKLREVVSAYPRALYAIEGHTDSTGDSAANQRLSQARADAVRSYMIERLQVPAGRVTAIGYGDSRPIAKNESAEGRRMNRRIDLVISPREQVAP